MQEHADFPLGGTDASVIALAERLTTATIVTLDRRHFSAVQPRPCGPQSPGDPDGQARKRGGKEKRSRHLGRLLAFSVNPADKPGVCTER